MTYRFEKDVGLLDFLIAPWAMVGICRGGVRRWEMGMNDFLGGGGNGA